MKKIIIIFTLIFIILSGCTNQVGGDHFFNQIDKLEKAIAQPEWSKVTSQAEELKQMFEEDKWKIQLIGDEDEYEGLDESISNLIAAAKEEDSINTRLELATVKSIFEGIYSL
ncbi:DUF4363 family protein [Oceanobacillus neutriphilus]|uniref:DUF4363 family protein n=1 Tax=Oceanobacillus neutriphilus TaxID=531815 RepID=A0ABQ2NSM4_9BACI|nr:DUF4363 family protein [Oceanobacillus neutriphilus]GGP09180.1 hypothetical protein GCM10011346_12200 [Oceanobacillus neutriphilus]